MGKPCPIFPPQMGFGPPYFAVCYFWTYFYKPDVKKWTKFWPSGPDPKKSSKSKKWHIFSKSGDFAKIRVFLQNPIFWKKRHFWPKLWFLTVFWDFEVFLRIPIFLTFSKNRDFPHFFEFSGFSLFLGCQPFFVKK